MMINRNYNTQTHTQTESPVEIGHAPVFTNIDALEFVDKMRLPRLLFNVKTGNLAHSRNLDNNQFVYEVVGIHMGEMGIYLIEIDPDRPLAPKSDVVRWHGDWYIDKDLARKYEEYQSEIKRQYPNPLLRPADVDKWEY